MSLDPLNPLEGITPLFSEEELEKINAYFDELAKPQLIINGVQTMAITIDQLVTFLKRRPRPFHRRGYQYPTYWELMRVAEILKTGGTRMLTRDQFIYMLNSWVLVPKINEQIILAFQVFDTENKNYLVPEVISSILSGYSDDPFDEAEIIEVLRDADVRGDGLVDYAEFVNSIFKVAPELFDIMVPYLYDDPTEDPSVGPEPPPTPPLPPRVRVPPPPLIPPKPPPKGKKKK